MVIEYFFVCIIEGLAYIHKKNIIHRDLNSENLVFTNKGYLRITNFGVGNLTSSNTITNDTSGTPRYIAPETMSQHPQTFTVDYFALGLMGYEFIYNKSHFKEQKKLN